MSILIHALRQVKLPFHTQKKTQLLSGATVLSTNFFTTSLLSINLDAASSVYYFDSVDSLLTGTSVSSSSIYSVLVESIDGGGTTKNYLYHVDLSASSCQEWPIGSSASSGTFSGSTCTISVTDDLGGGYSLVDTRLLSWTISATTFGCHTPC